jgi:putative restriction endonuclease
MDGAPSQKVNQYERAFRTWPILTARAAERKTITYGELAKHLGIHPRPIRFVLGVIQQRCLDDKKPPLTILVVNQSGRPGHGFIAWDVDDLDKGYEQVFAFPWAEWPNPFAFADDGSTLEELADHVVRKPQEASVVYGRIQNRGFAQIVFRLALLTAYNRRCAFCGLSIVSALQAAHIIPWADASHAERVLPANGLLLCATHHALFDTGIMTVDQDRHIECRQGELPGHRWTEADRRAAIALHGQSLSLPADPRHQPSGKALAYRAKRLNH